MRIQILNTVYLVPHRIHERENTIQLESSVHVNELHAHLCDSGT